MDRKQDGLNFKMGSFTFLYHFSWIYYRF